MPDVSRTSELPEGIHDLVARARREGHLHVDRLVDDYRAGRNRFRLPHEALFQAHDGMRLAGVGGLNVDPYAVSGAVGRLRRFYVHPEHRRRGIGRALVAAIESHARGRFDALRLFTRNADADRFYVALGYERVCDDEHASHAKQLILAPAPPSP